MPTLPPITIVATTWAPEGIVGVARLNSWATSLQSWVDQLAYEGDLYLHVADDGSRAIEGVPAPFKTAGQLWDRVYHEGLAATCTWQHRRGVGASLNAGFAKAFERSPLVAYFVDDWKLVDSIDLTPWAELLMRDESVGMVRLGPPHPGLVGRIEMFDEGWAIRLDPRAGGFVFGHRPALYHRRMIEAYGLFAEGESAYECERLYNVAFAEKAAASWRARDHGWPDGSNPDVIYALPYPWRHIGDQEVGDIVPVP